MGVKMCGCSQRIIFRAIQYLISFASLCVSLLLTWEVFMKYKSMGSGFKRMEKSITNLPTLTLCFSPMETQFVYGQDFKILNFPSFYDFHLYDEEDYALKEGDNSNLSLTLTQMLTVYNGICYKITPSTRCLEKNDWNIMVIDFHENIPLANIPNILLFVTSEDNSLGILRTYWFDGEVLMLKITTKHKYIEYGLKEEQHVFLKEKSKCRDEPFYKCYGKALLAEDFAQCPKKCLPHWLPNKILPSNENVKLCEVEPDEIDCANEVAREVRQKVVYDETCSEKACCTTTYTGVINNEVTSEEPLHMRAFSYHFSPPASVTMNEEYLIYDFVGFLAAIGGTMGMWIGFSFVCFSSLLLKNIQSLINYIFSPKYKFQPTNL